MIFDYSYLCRAITQPCFMKISHFRPSSLRKYHVNYYARACAGKTTITDSLFATFAVTWVILRLGIFPFIIVPSTL